MAGGVVDRNPASPAYGYAKENYAAGLGFLATLLEGRKPKPETEWRKDDEKWMLEDDYEWDPVREARHLEEREEDYLEEYWDYEEDRVYLRDTRVENEYQDGTTRIRGVTDVEKFQQWLLDQNRDRAAWADDDDAFYEQLTGVGESLVASPKVRRAPLDLIGLKTLGATNGEKREEMKTITKSEQPQSSSAVAPVRVEPKVAKLEASHSELPKETQSSLGLKEELALKSAASATKPVGEDKLISEDSKPLSKNQKKKARAKSLKEKKKLEKPVKENGSSERPSTQISKDESLAALETKTDQLMEMIENLNKKSVLPVKENFNPKPKEKSKGKEKEVAFTPEVVIKEILKSGDPEAMENFVNTLLTKLASSQLTSEQKSGKPSLSATSATPMADGATSSAQAASSAPGKKL